MFYARIVARHRPSLINLKALEGMPLDKRLDTIFTVFEEKLDLFVLFTILSTHKKAPLFIS